MLNLRRINMISSRLDWQTTVNLQLSRHVDMQAGNCFWH
jgi:hypothetical protein